MRIKQILDLTKKSVTAWVNILQGENRDRH